MRIIKFPKGNHENHENQRSSSQNQENHENLRIPLENHKNNENQIKKQWES